MSDVCRFSDEELKQISELQTKYGVNKWTRIGQDLGRSGIAVKDMYRWTQSQGV